MIELIVLSREKDRTKRFNTRLKKIKAWVTLKLDLENTQHLFKAREDFNIDSIDERLPITIIKLNWKDNLVVDAFGADIPSNYQLSIKIKEIFSELIKIIEEKAEKQGYKNGWNESEHLHSEQ